MSKLSLTTLSIVIPVYAGQQYLPALLEAISCLRSDLAKYNISICEVICIVDDAMDNSHFILQNCIDIYDFLRIITMASNVGQHQATAVGILSAGSEWIITMDEDLQHPPHLIPSMLSSCVRSSYDLLYCKSNIRVHRGSLFRDFTSILSKQLVSFLAATDFSGVSSFRLMRSEIAKSAAVSMDQTLYLDSLLFRITSPHRRSTIYNSLVDIRAVQSTYSVRLLWQHLARFLASTDVSFSRITAIALVVILSIFASFLVLVVYGYYDGVLSAQPGWASLMLAILFSITISTFGFLFAYKLLVLLAGRSIRMPSFIVVDRSKDIQVATAIDSYMASIEQS